MIKLWLQGWVLGLGIAAPVGPIGVLCIRQTLAQGWAVGLATGLGAATADACYGAIVGLGLTTVTHWLLDYQGLLQGLGGLFLCYLGIQTWRSAPQSLGFMDARGDRSGDDSGDRSGNNPGDRSGNNPGDRPGNYSGDRSGNNPGDRSQTNPLGRVGDDRGDDRPSPQPPQDFPDRPHGPNHFNNKPRKNAHPSPLGNWLKAYGSTYFLTLTNPATILAFTALFSSLGLATLQEPGRSALEFVGGIFLGSATWWLFLSSTTARLRHHLTPRALVGVNRISAIIITAFGFLALGQRL
jgi:threonine/homoserine/homoserine lactone efflux protein